MHHVIWRKLHKGKKDVYWMNLKDIEWVKELEKMKNCIAKKVWFFKWNEKEKKLMKISLLSYLIS